MASEDVLLDLYKRSDCYTIHDTDGNVAHGMPFNLINRCSELKELQVKVVNFWKNGASERFAEGLFKTFLQIIIIFSEKLEYFGKKGQVENGLKIKDFFK